MLLSEKFKVLVVDDSKFNRELLGEILKDSYEVVEATNGKDALSLLSINPTEYSVVLLDINMPVLDGFGVLHQMNQKNWINDVPVVMISSEIDRKTIQRAYELGATDFITRPYDAGMVKQRVKNTIMLYAKQRKMANILVDQMYEKEKSMSLMISVLSHIVEFRNGESGAHILNVNRITGLLLRSLVTITDQYDISNKQISLICTASALHDIGKISIDENILNKPGKLTPEEFEIMKTHSAVGGDMLASLPGINDEPLIQYGYEICRWHHERYDGHGYPDHLIGDEIPISAQVVSIADVYDALTADRCYKKAYTHEVAMEMILGGECGTFNPLLLKALVNVAPELKKGVGRADNVDSENTISILRDDISKIDEGIISDQKIKRFEIEHERVIFLQENIDGLCFTYQEDPETFKITKKTSEILGIPDLIVNPSIDDDFIGAVKDGFLDELKKESSKTSSENPSFTISTCFKIGGEVMLVDFNCRAIWVTGDTKSASGVIGRSIRIERVNS